MRVEAFEVSWPLIAAALIALSALVIVALLLSMLRRKPRRISAKQEDLSVDLAALGPKGPPPDGPQLEYYGTPVRLVALVMAPAGRGGTLPPPDQLRQVVDHWIPGMAKVLDSHQPLFRRWPEQLSSQGFSQSFFANLQLPGDRGKGTPWCSAAGRFDYLGRPILMGAVCCASGPNGLSQIVVQHEGQWHDVLRVRPASAA